MAKLVLVPQAGKKWGPVVLDLRLSVRSAVHSANLSETHPEDGPMNVTADMMSGTLSWVTWVGPACSHKHP